MYILQSAKMPMSTNESVFETQTVIMQGKFGYECEYTQLSCPPKFQFIKFHCEVV